MPRPVRKRTIYQKPDCTFFTAEEAGKKTVQLTLDELEALRLMDEVGLDQKECALRMHVGRSTFQNILNEARKKAAGALVHGWNIALYGGQVEVSDHAELGCCRFALRTLERIGGISQREEKTMKLAVTYDPKNGEIFQHFGRTEYFKIYDLADGKVQKAEVHSTQGQGHGALAGVLQQLGIDGVICGGIGGGAQEGLKKAGIAFYGGCSGQADQAVEDFLADKLQYQEDIQCDHHGEHHHGECHH